MLLCVALAALVPGAAGDVAAQTPGLVPLTDLGAGAYQGFQGGLYPGGANVPPPAHLAAALDRASQIVPRAASGAPDPNGWIVMIAVGMSNTTHEFAVFERLEDASPARNARVVIMDTAFGGQNATAIADPNAPYWTTLRQRLSAMRLTPAQVQVAWLKEAEANPPANFPVHAQGLRDNLEIIAGILHDKFQHLKLCYLSSRTYGGYAAPGTLNPEPQAYESGFSVKWLIEDQIDGDPDLDYGAGPGPVRAPLLLWGPYLWANGPTPRSDGLTWLVDDFESDHVHPAPPGELKVAQLLSGFFASEATASAWWRPVHSDDLELRTVDAVKDAHVRSDSPTSSFGNGTQLLVQGSPIVQRAYAGFDLAGVTGPFTLAKLSLRVSASGGGTVSRVMDTSWTEAGLTWENAPAPGGMLASMPGSSRDGTIAADVTAAVSAAAGGLLDVVLASPAASEGSYISREGNQPPRMVLAGPRSCPGGDTDGDGRADICDCAPLDAGLKAWPAEVGELLFVNETDLSWSPVAPQAGTGTLYDVMSGDLSEVASFGPRSGDLCLASGGSAAQAADNGLAPPAGTGRFYLVRARNGCGVSRWETATSGQDRTVTGCGP